MSSTKRASKTPFNPTESAPNFLAPITPQAFDPTGLVPAVSFPKFPTVEEQLAHAEGRVSHPLLSLGVVGAAERPAETSLFDGLLGGQSEALQQDAADHPEKYDEQTRLLLHELRAGARKLQDLDPSARRLLDRATLDFATYKAPAAPRAAAPKAPAPKPVRTIKPRFDALEDGRAPQVEEPGGVMTAYWWLQ